MALPVVDIAELESELEPDSEVGGGRPKHVRVRNYRVAYQDYTPGNRRGFLDFNDLGKTGKHIGWKFHIAVVPAQRQEACNIIVDVLSRHGIKQFKMSNTQRTVAFTDPNLGQQGKIFTVYSHGEASMADAMHEIEEKLHAAAIQPAFAPLGDRRVKGSRYLYYRNDRNLDGEYIEAAALRELPEAQRYNPYNRPDPYASMDMSAIHEADRRAFAEAETKDKAYAEQTGRLTELLPAYHQKEMLCGVNVVQSGKPCRVPAFVAPVDKLNDLYDIEAGLTQLGIQTVREYVPRPLGFPENEARNITPILRIRTKNVPDFERTLVENRCPPWQDTVVLEPRNYADHKIGWDVFSQKEMGGFTGKEGQRGSATRQK